MLGAAAGCASGHTGVSDAGAAHASDAGSADAGLDAAAGPADAAPDAEPEHCGVAWPGSCVGVGCEAGFDPNEGDGVEVRKGVLVLSAGEDEGEVRHVFESPCDAGLAANWHSATVSGAEGEVRLEARGADSVEALGEVDWVPLDADGALDELSPGGCGPRLLEVRIRLLSPRDREPARVERLDVCVACTAIFC